MMSFWDLLKINTLSPPPFPVPALPVSTNSEPVKRPKYYPIINKKYEYINITQYGGPPGSDFYVIRAKIVDRDSMKEIKSVSGFFKTLDLYEEGLKNLTENIETEIKGLHEKDRLDARIMEAIVNTQIALDGMVWFWK